MESPCRPSCSLILGLPQPGRERPLSFLVGSLVPVIEALMVVVVLATALSGATLSASTNIGGGVSPDLARPSVALWVAGSLGRQPSADALQLERCEAP